MIKNLIRITKNTYKFCSYVLKSFFKDDGTYCASALTLTSLLAIVPLMGIGIDIFTQFPYFKTIYVGLQNFIFANFIPSSGVVVQKYLQNFADHASNLSLFGGLFLIVTIIFAMLTLDHSMNRIWKIENHRKGIYAIILYWGILALVPVLFALITIASSILLSFGIELSWFFQALPFFIIVLSFMLLYVVVPNCKVPMLNGFIGAIVASTLFELTKMAFSYYISNFHLYEILYGAFSAVPIFMLWVYWVWVVILLGAEVSHGLTIKKEIIQK